MPLRYQPAPQPELTTVVYTATGYQYDSLRALANQALVDCGFVGRGLPMLHAGQLHQYTVRRAAHPGNRSKAFLKRFACALLFLHIDTLKV